MEDSLLRGQEKRQQIDNLRAFHKRNEEEAPVALERLKKEALASFNKALKANPKDINALLSKGTVLEIEGHLEDALDCYNRVLKIKPKNVTAKKNKKRVVREIQND